MATPSLPWSDEFLERATIQDLRRIPEDSIRTLDHEKIDDIDAKFLVMKAQRFHERRLERERLGLPPAPPKPLFDEEPPVDSVVQVVQERGWEDFGYYLYRTSFEDDDRYARWSEEFQKQLDKSLERSSGGAAIMDRLFTATCTEPDLDGLSWPELQEYHRECANDNPYGDGVLDDAFLCVDAAAMSSLLEPDSNTPPWVWMVDGEFDFSSDDAMSDDDEPYPGYFKIAIDALLPEMFPLHATDTPLDELWAACPPSAEHPVWMSSTGPY